MEITFDPDKDAANLAKHGVSLAFAARVRADPDRLDVLDVRHDYAEEQIISYGRVDQRVWVCVHSPRDDRLRVISLRKANAREIRRYDETPR